MDDTEETVTARATALVQDHEQLLKALVKHRVKHSLTQEVVAERMGVTQPTVARFESYLSNPTLSTLRRYATAVGARIETIVTDDCVPHSEASRRGNSNSKTKFFDFVYPTHETHSDGWVREEDPTKIYELVGRGRGW